MLDPKHMTRGASGARAEADWLASILDSAFDAIVVVEAVRGPGGSVEDLRYALLNPGAEELLGVRAEDLVGRSVLEAFPGLADAGVHRDLVTVAETGKRLETQFHYDADGFCAWFRMSAVRFGEHVSLTVRDVTREVEREHALQKSEQYLRFITSTSRDILSFHAPSGEILWVSEACRDLVGASPEALIGRAGFEGLHPDDVPGVRTAIRHLVKDRREQTITARCRHHEGHYVWVQSLGRPVTDPMDELIGFMLSTRQVDEQIESHRALERTLKDLQRANEALEVEKQRSETAAEAKTRFLATMSHEIRTPLNGIIGVLSLLEREAFPPHISELMDTLHASGAALLSLVNDILDFSKIEAGELQLEKHAFPPEALLADVMSVFRPSAESKGVTLELKVSERLPESIISDRVRLRQILFNLTGNAIKFTPRGRVKVSADFDPDDRTLRLEVEDTGIGIPEEALKTIFRPFSQADSSTTRKFGGTGLGLAIVSSLTKMLGGGLTVQSKEKEGTRFRVTIPLDAWGDAQLDELTPTETLSSSLDDIDIPKLRVLLVEDNLVNRKVAATMIKRLGHRVESAADGIEALERVRAETFDLVLMDLQMPRMDGLEATKQIRRKYGDTLPIIALTANAFDEDRVACLDAGMNGHLTKPLRLDDLRQALSSY